MNFRKWLEFTGDNSGIQTTRAGYDQNLQKPEGLAYRSPIIPKKKTLFSKKIAALFGKKDDE
jgi:hypothetical protein